MQIPVAMYKNLEAGEIKLTYAEVDREQLGAAFAVLYNRQHPEAPITKKTKEDT